MSKYVIYSDGSCLSNPDGAGAWAFVLLRDNKVIVEKAEYNPSTTNNRMELTAAIRGLESAIQHGAKSAIVYSDSKYVVDGAMSWIEGWKKRNWKIKGGSEVKNIDLWKQIADLKERIAARFIWVKGHAGNSYNERADQMAQQCAISRKKPETVFVVSPEPEPEPLVSMHCCRCHGTDVHRDAYVAWNEELQQWEISGIYDDAWCDTCDGETKIEELRILP